MFDRYIVAPHTAACVADETTCTHGVARLTATLTRWDTEQSQTVSVELMADDVAGFVEYDRWDGPEVVNVLCAAGILSAEDFGGQGDLIGYDLDRWDVTARITLPRPLLESPNFPPTPPTWPAEDYCEEHGTAYVVDAGSSPGYTGAGIYWTKLSCGCTDVDDSADNIGAVR